MKFTPMVLAAVLTLSCSMLLSCDNTNGQPATSTSPQLQDQPLSQPMSAQGAGMMQPSNMGCPMTAQGADVTVEDTDGGVTLTFTTDDTDVADLRARVQGMSQLYAMHQGRAGMMWHNAGRKGMGHGAGMGMGRGMGAGAGMKNMMGSGPMPATSATVTDTDKGASIELRPTDAAQLDALRQHVLSHQQRMHSGECWMMQEQPAAQDTPE